MFDAEGQLLTASFLDYAMPRADDYPGFDFATHNVPSTTNPLGVKGAGEAGIDRLAAGGHQRDRRALWRAYKIAHIDMPATPFAVYDAIRRSRIHA